MADLVVVGAGPAGLTAAWRAARRGLSVLVVEHRSVVGGLTGGLVVADQAVDLGSHRLHDAMGPQLGAALQGLLGDDLQERTRHGRLRLADRWLRFPLRAADLARHLPPSFTVAMARAAAPHPRRRAAVETSFADVITARFGPPMLDWFYGPYARKLWGIEPDRLSAQVARHRVATPGRARLLGQSLAGAGAQRRRFRYPRRGFGQIADAIASAAVDAGAEIALDSAVVGLVPGATGSSVTVASGDRRRELAAGRVLWTAPPAPLVEALGAGSDHACEIASDVAVLRNRAMTLVYLVVDRPRYSEFDAHYLPQIDVRATRISEPKNYRDGDDPPDHTVLCVEIPCATDEAIWRSDDLAVALALESIERSSMPPAAVIGTRVVRLPAVYPIGSIATEAARARVDAWAGSLPGVTVLGRQGLGVADNLHHVMAMGWHAGELAADGWDDDVWQRHRASYRRHVIVD